MTESNDPRGGRPPFGSEGVIEFDLAERDALGPSALRVHFGELPTGKTPARTELAVSPGEVTRVADYGRAPESFWSAPRYAWRVTLRRRAIRVESDRLREALRRAERDRDALLADVVTALRPRLEAQGRLQTLLQPRAGTRRDSLERIALADVGRALLAQGDLSLLEEDTIPALRERDQAVLRLAIDLETHLEALDAFDHDQVRVGQALTAAIALVVVVSATVAIAYFG